MREEMGHIRGVRLRQTGQHILEVRERIDSLAAAGLRERVQYRGGAAAGIAAGEEPVLAFMRISA